MVNCERWCSCLVSQGPEPWTITPTNYPVNPIAEPLTWCLAKGVAGHSHWCLVPGRNVVGNAREACGSGCDRCLTGRSHGACFASWTLGECRDKGSSVLGICICHLCLAAQFGVPCSSEFPTPNACPNHRSRCSNSSSIHRCCCIHRQQQQAVAYRTFVVHGVTRRWTPRLAHIDPNLRVGAGHAFCLFAQIRALPVSCR